uniref:Not1 n=1 Tax=Schmidtea mediterranea TaxID=79327 RepID=V5W3Q6_SCHMD|nr:not1 [Schmidtea mediterranea]
MTDNLNIASNQIISLILSINKKNYKQTSLEINQLVKLYKSDAEHHLFRVLFSSIDFSLSAENKSTKDLYKCQLLLNEINGKMSKPNFSSLLIQAIDRPFHPHKCIKPKNQLLPQISKVLKLNKVQEVVFGLSLFQSSNKETVNIANQFVRQKLLDLLRSYVDDNGGKENAGFQEITMEILHLILTTLLKDKDNFGIGQDQLLAFLNTLKKDFPKVDFPVVLSVILYNEDESIFEKEIKDLGFNKYDKNYLSEVIEELGSVSTNSIDEMRATLQDFDSKCLGPAAIAKCICMFMRTSAKSSPLQISIHRLSGGNEVVSKENEITEWNLENFFTVIFEKNPSINKCQIIEELDCREFDASTKSALSILHICISHCISAFPNSIFYSIWKNSVAQFSFFKGVFYFPEVISFLSWPHRKCDLSVIKIKIEDESIENQIGFWKNIDYIEALLKLSDNGLLMEVTEIFEIPMKQVPQILICSLIQFAYTNALKSRLLLKLFTLFIAKPVPISLFTIAWNINIEIRPLILSSLFDYYKESENTYKNLSCVFRIADIISDIKAVQYILPSNPNVQTPNIFKANSSCFRYEAVHFALDIVIYCTKKNSDFLSQWVNELLSKELNQIQNFKSLVSYIHLRYPKLIDNEDSKFIVPRELILDAQCLFDFLKNLDSIGKLQFQSDPIIYQEIHIINVMLSKLSQMMNPNMGNMNIPSSQTRQNALPVNTKLSRNKLDPTRSAFIPQSKTNRNDIDFIPDVNRTDFVQQPPTNEFKSIDQSKYKNQIMMQYNSGLVVQPDEKVHKIDSTMTIEQEILKNLKMLFEGEMSLQNMCELYLNSVKCKRESLNILIRMLVDELTYINDYPEKHGKIYADLFIQILSMENNLLTKPEINRIYELLICNQNALNAANSDGKNAVGREIIDRIISITNFKKTEVILNEQMIIGTSATSSNAIPSITAVTTSIVFGNIEPPPENVTEKVLFIINNVSKLNVQEKASQLSELVTQEYVPWFSHYIVVKRVTTEANFHELFIQLIDCMSDQLTGLRDKVLLETYRNIKILLANMKSDLSDFNDRQLLKNLGKFLGMITLAKNKPILHDDMNLKDMLYEAYNKGHIELHYVVPFVTKTLEGAKDSIVFKPPCPWTMAILRVLKELHEVDSVKLNLKFEVEILCRNLKCDFTKLTPALFLNDRNVRIETSLCRIVPLASSQPTSSGPIDVQPSDGLSLQSISFGNRSGVHFINDARSIQMANSRPQNLDSLDPSRGPSMKSNIQYSQAISTHNPQSTAIMNCQNVSLRSTGQDASQYYSMMGNTQSNFASSQQTNPLASNTVEHLNSAMRSSSIPYEDLNTSNIAGYLNVDDIPSPILNQIPNLKMQLIATMERIVFDLVSPLYDRCAKITIGTVEQLVLKDFGMDGELKTIKQYAFGMCRNLTAGLCLVTAREIIGVHLNTAVKQTILGEYRHVNTQDKEQVDNFANKIVSSNNEICVAFLQKIVAEKAISELEKKLNSIVISDASKRNQYKPSTQELQVYESFNRNIPGFSIHPLQISSSISGPWNTNVMTNLFHQKSQLATRQFAVASGENIIENPISRMISEIERQMTIINNMARNDIFIRSLRQILDTAYLALQNSDPQLIHRLMRETVSSFMNMYHTQITKDHAPASLEIMERLKEAHMYALRIMQPYEESSGFISVNKQVTIAWSNMEDLQRHGPGKWNGEAFCELLKTHVICLPVMDVFIAKRISENNISALFFILDLLKNFVTGDKREFTVLNEFDLSSTIEAMNQVVQKNQLKLQQKDAKLLNFNLVKINQLMDLGCLDRTVSPIYLYNGISLSREFDDPPTMPERSEIMIRMWMEHYCSNSQRDNNNIQTIINSMTQTQIIHNDETFVRFLRLASVYVVERAHKQLKQDNIIPNSNRSASYTEIDAYAMLVCCLILRSNLNKNEISGKSCLLNKSLGIIAGTLLQEHEVRRDWFHPMPFQRILIMLFNELQTSIEEEDLGDLQQHVLTAFSHTFHVIRPKCAPSFVFSWLELISHRSFISKMLTNSNLEYTHSMYIQLLCDLYSFLRPYLENLHLPRPVQTIYKGAVSLTCLLMHDFPELLINYHALLCTIIPINCIQLRNIILCTTTKKMLPLPDVLKTTHLEQLSQMEDPTGYCMSAGERIKPLSLRNKLDSYLVSRAPVKFLSELVNGLKKDNECQISNINVISPKEISKLINVPEEHIARNSYYFKSTGTMHYDIELMNNVILYLCITAVKVLREKNIPLNINTIAHTAQMDIIQSLVLNLDNEGRFLLLNCMANQLRYPNSHSFYFKNTLLYLFAEQPQESVKEQITRVILERIIVNRPHPWGLLVVMNELFKNPTYRFWDHKFLHCSEEVEKIIESVVKGCRGSIPPQLEEINNSGITAES